MNSRDRVDEDDDLKERTTTLERLEEMGVHRAETNSLETVSERCREFLRCSS